MQLLTYKISPEQRRKIFQLLNELKMKKDELYDLSKEWCNCISLSAENCTFSQAEIIIKNLTAIKDKVRPGYISPKQRQALMSIKKQLKWKDEDLNKFILHTVGKDYIDDLTTKEASQVIVGIKTYKKV